MPEVFVPADRPELRPHAVHTKNAIQRTTTKVRTYDPERGGGGPPEGEDVHPAYDRFVPDGDGFRTERVPEARDPYWEIDDTTTIYTGPTDCPDCGLGLASRGDDMVCVRIGTFTAVDVTACHEGCIIACGVTE